MTAITDAQAKKWIKDRQTKWKRACKTEGDGFYKFLTNFDATTGAMTVTVADTVAGTDALLFKVGPSSLTKPKISLASPDGAKTGDFTLSVTPGTLAASRSIYFPDSLGADDVIVTQAMTQTLVGKTLTTPTILDFTNATHDHADAAGGGTITTTTVGTTGNVFDIDSDSNIGMIRLQVTTGAADYKLILTNAALTASDKTATFQNLTGTVGLISCTGQAGYLQLDGATSGAIKIAPIATGTATTTIQNQNVSAATITLPAITSTLAILGANTFTGTQTCAAIVTTGITGSDASLGVAGTAGAAGGAGGIVAVVGGLGHTNGAGGAITVIGGGGAGTGAGGATTLKGGDSGTGTTGNGGAATVQGGAATSTAGAGGAVAVTGGLGTTTGAGGAITIVGGAGGTKGDGGAITITSGASGGASDTAGAVAIDTGSKTGGTDGALTIGAANAASIAIGKAAEARITTINGELKVSLTDAGTATVTDVLTLSHTGGTPAAGLGTGLSFEVKDAGGVEEQGSIDVELRAVGNDAEDADFVFKLNKAGAMTEVMRIKADVTGSGGATMVQIGADAKQASLELFPTTTSLGTLRFTAADSAGDTTTLITNASQAGARTYTIPDAGASASFAMTAGAQTLTGVNTFTAAPVVTITDAGTNSVTDVATFTHLGGTPAAGLGLGLSFIVENATDGTTQVASIDFVNTNASCTKASLDTDIIFSTMLAGTVTPAVTVDASAQELVIGQDATDPNGLHALRIWPLTEGQGSILIQPTDNTGDDTITITNGNTGGDITVTLPTVTSTLAILGANTFTATQTIQGLTASSGAYAMNFGASSGAFTTSTGTNTISGTVSLAANKNIACAAGTTAVDWSLGTGVFKTTTGEITVGGNVTQTGTKTFTTGTGAVALLGDVTVKGGIDTATGTALTVGAANATSLAVGATDITTTLNGVVKSDAEGYVVYTTVHAVTAAEINAASHTLVTVPAGRSFQLVDAKIMATGGSAATLTSLELTGSADMVSWGQAALTQSTLLLMDNAGTTILADGASFTAQTAGTDVQLTKTGGDLTTATGVTVVVSYILI